jgi:hypothetical protein
MDMNNPTKMTRRTVAPGAAPAVPKTANGGGKEFERQKEIALDEMVRGYRGGRDPDSPPPCSNRTLSYVHGFNVGRGDHRGQPFHDAATLRLLAEVAIETDALEACR